MFARPALLYERDPAHFSCLSRRVSEAQMGDIVQLDEERVELAVEVTAAAPIERPDILNGADVIETVAAMAKQIAVRRLPDTLSTCEMKRTLCVDIRPGRNNPL